MLVNISNAELHNLVKRKGGLEVRPSYQPVKVPPLGSVYVGGFSVESPFTTEVWHYLFEQDTGTMFCTMRVYTEEFLEMFSHPLGALPKDPIITHAVVNHQIMVNSPSFSAPLYGLVGGGLIQAIKTESQNPDTTALELPQGHIASFGDRMPIAQGNIIYFNDPGVDPRTYVAQNALPLSGTIYDMFQGDDGALYCFTSAGVFFIAQDALGKGQRVEGFIGNVPGLQTSKPRNAAASNGVVAVLQKHGIAILGGRNQVIDVAPYKGPRYYSIDVEVDDYRTAGEIHATSEGFLVAFRGQRDFLLDFNLRDGYRSYIWSESGSFDIVGTLRSRENETLLISPSQVLLRLGNRDFLLAAPVAVAAQELDLPEGAEAMLRHIVISSDNIGGTSGVYAAHQAKTDTVPPRGSDVVINTTSWDASRKYAGVRPRSVRHSMRERVTHLPIEVVLPAPDVGTRLEANIDVQFKGQGKRRGDRR